VIQTINNFKGQTIPPSVSGIISLLGSITYFTFGPKRNLAIGGALFLYLWNHECNRDYKILSEEEVIKLLDELFRRTSKML